MKQLISALTAAGLIALALFTTMNSTAVHAEQVAARVTQKIDEKNLTALSGHVRPFLGLTTDHGSVEASKRTGPIMLMLSRTPKQQADLDSFVDQAHNRNSPNFHKWLTPVEFGNRFQPADADVAAVKAWLESKGFTILDVVPSKTHISFTGTVGQLRDAFHVDIHHVSINGEAHMATVSEPQIPAALAPVIGGLHKLDDFSPKPLVKVFGAFDRDIKTGKVTKAKGSVTGPTANFTGSESGSTFYEMGPQDFYTIYNENPLLNAGITGAGQTIAVIEEQQVVAADVTSFRSVFGLPAYPATPNATAGGVNYLYGNSSTGLGGYASCYAPATTTAGSATGTGEESEADIDLQWAGAVAPNAIIDFVACGGTATSADGSTLGSLGIDHSAQYIANYLAGSVVAASMSYGECEAQMTSSTTTGVGYYNNQWEQFAAEGITPIISSGDGGAEQCYQNKTYATTYAPSVNGFGDSAYNVSAGGTDFGDLYESNNYTTSPATTWWTAANATGGSSAVGYVPETTWAGYCSGQLYSSYLQKAASTTYGTTYTPSAICSSAAAKTNGLLAVVGGAGGISTYNTIPTWQSVYGVGLNSVSTTYRNIPDVSLFASNGWWGHFLPFCESDYYACTVADYTAGDMGAGGTSYVAPQLAGLMALISQKTGARQGQANYTFYNLAAQQYGTPGNPSSSIAACSGSAIAPGQRPPSSCYYYDVSNDMPSLQGGTITPGIYQPCDATFANCYQGSGTTYGVNLVPGTTATDGILGYTASPGYDDATGLGSLNIAGIVNGWNNTSPSFASTITLATNASGAIQPTGSVVLTATVAATGRGGTVAPAGLVGFFIGSSLGTSLGTGSVTSNCTGTGPAVSCQGVATLTVAATALAPGSNSIVAYFQGDGANDAPSTSAAQTMKVYGNPVGNLEQAVDASTGSTTIPSTDKLFVSGWAADPIDGSPLTNVTIYIDGTSVGTPTLGISRPDVASYTGNSAYGKSGFNFSYAASSLSGGSHTVSAVATDSDGLSTTLGSLTITVMTLYPAPLGNLEQAVDYATSSSTIPTTDTLFVSGWIADPTDGSPLANVKVYIDGNLIGTPTMNVSRSDVTSYYNNSAYANSGFNFSYPASSLSAGSHSVTVVGINSHSVSTTLAPKTITVTATYPAPLGNLEQAVDYATSSSTIPTTDTLFVSGWIADPTDGSPLANVKVYIDGNLIGTPTMNVSRSDVASYYNNSAYANSGFNFSYPASSLSAGSHSVTVVGINSHSVSTTLAPKTITVTATYPAPLGNLEQAVDYATSSSTIPATDTLFVSGWIADATDGSPLANVKVYIDGTSVGTPTMNVSRPDVASYYSNSAYANSGFNFSYPASSLTVVSHSVTVVGINSHGGSTTLGPKTITVTAPAQASKSVQSLGSNTVTAFSQGCGFNTYGNLTEIDAVAAAGCKIIRINCANWASVEGQSAAPNNNSTGYSMPAVCASQITRAAQDGLNVQTVAAYGSTFHKILNVTTAAAVPLGATSIPLVLTSAVNGSTWTTGSFPLIYLYGTGVSGTNFTGKYTYAGSVITSLTVTDSTHATATLSSAVTTALASGTALAVNQALYSFSTNDHYASDSFTQHYAAYVQHLETLVLGIMNPICPTCQVITELWNEPPWGGDGSDNGRDLYDIATLGVTQSGTNLTVANANSATIGGVASTYGLHVGDCLTGTGFPSTDPNRDCVTALGTGTGGTGTYTMSQSVNVSSLTTVTTDPGFLYLVGNGPNYGFAAALMSGCPTNAFRSWGGTNKSGAADLLGSRMLAFSGTTYTQPNSCLSFEMQHPYSNNPEDNGYNLAKIQANPNAGLANNLLSTSTSNFYLIAANSYISQQANGPTYGISTGTSETGTSMLYQNSTTGFTRFIMRLWPMLIVSGQKTVEFFETFQLNASATNLTSAAASSGGTTVYAGSFATGAASALAGTYFTVSGFTNAANNGQFVATASTATTLTLQNSGGVAETRAASASYVTTPGYSFITMKDNTGGGPCSSSTACLASTSFTALPQYTAMLGAQNDIASIAHAPVASYTSASLPSVASYSGGYQLAIANLVGSRTGASSNSAMTLLWQMSATANAGGTIKATTNTMTTPNVLTGISTGDIAKLAVGYPLSGPGVVTGATITALGTTTATMSANATAAGANVTITYNRWADLPSPPPGTVTLTIPSGMAVTSVTDWVTRAAVPYSVSGSTLTTSVADNTVGVLMDPAATSSVKPAISGGQLTISH